MMDFSIDVKGYRLGCLDSKNVVCSCDVNFNELKMLKFKVQVPDNSNDNSQPVEFETFVVPQGIDKFESEVGQDGCSSSESEAAVVSFLQ